MTTLVPKKLLTFLFRHKDFFYLNLFFSNPIKVLILFLKSSKPQISLDQSPWFRSNFWMNWSNVICEQSSRIGTWENFGWIICTCLPLSKGGYFFLSKNPAIVGLKCTVPDCVGIFFSLFQASSHKVTLAAAAVCTSEIFEPSDSSSMCMVGPELNMVSLLSPSLAAAATFRYNFSHFRVKTCREILFGNAT